MPTEQMQNYPTEESLAVYTWNHHKVQRKSYRPVKLYKNTAAFLQTEAASSLNLLESPKTFINPAFGDPGVETLRSEALSRAELQHREGNSFPQNQKIFSNTLTKGTYRALLAARIFWKQSWAVSPIFKIIPTFDDFNQKCAKSRLTVPLKYTKTWSLRSCWAQKREQKHDFGPSSQPYGAFKSTLFLQRNNLLRPNFAKVR